MKENGKTLRNWQVLGLTDENRVILQVNGERRETQERPSDFWGIAYLSRAERGILRRGVTPGGRDRATPKR